MTSVGVGEFKKSAGKVLQRVRVAQESIEITSHGVAIARLVPVVPTKAEPKKLAKIGSRWPRGILAVGAVREQRR